jgi:hypothetical protein
MHPNLYMSIEYRALPVRQHRRSGWCFFLRLPDIGYYNTLFALLGCNSPKVDGSEIDPKDCLTVKGFPEDVVDEEFEVAFSGKAWQACDKIDSVDGTIEMEARSIQRPNLKFLGLIHGHLSRVFPIGLFAVKVSLSQVIEILE